MNVMMAVQYINSIKNSLMSLFRISYLMTPFKM